MTHQYGNPPDGELKARAQQVGEQARMQAESRLEQQKHGAAERLERLASGVRAAAGELEQQDDAQLSQYVARFAGTLGELAEGLRSKNVDELMHDLRAAARRNPGLFVAGSVAIGFGLARFARASGAHTHAGAQQMGARGTAADADAMGASALDGSDGGYRGSLSSHGPGAPAGGLHAGPAAATRATGTDSRGSIGSSSIGSSSLGTGSGSGSGSGSMPSSSASSRGPGSSGRGATGGTPPTTRGGTQP